MNVIGTIAFASFSAVLLFGVTFALGGYYFQLRDQAARKLIPVKIRREEKPLVLKRSRLNRW